MVKIQDMPQSWWEIECTYDGIPGSLALAAGETQLQAESNFRASLMYPELAVGLRMRRLGLSTAVQAIASLVGRNV
jgi:hypothetical protein